jgi:hypothetical protein
MESMTTQGGSYSYNAICDVCGFQYKASELKKRWDGLMVCSDDYETRHPMDFYRVKNDFHPLPFIRSDNANISDNDGYWSPIYSNRPWVYQDYAQAEGLVSAPDFYLAETVGPASNMKTGDAVAYSGADFQAMTNFTLKGFRFFLPPDMNFDHMWAQGTVELYSAGTETLIASYALARWESKVQLRKGSWNRFVFADAGYSDVDVKDGNLITLSVQRYKGQPLAWTRAWNFAGTSTQMSITTPTSHPSFGNMSMEVVEPCYVNHFAGQFGHASTTWPTVTSTATYPTSVTTNWVPLWDILIDPTITTAPDFTGGIPRKYIRRINSNKPAASGRLANLAILNTYTALKDITITKGKVFIGNCVANPTGANAYNLVLWVWDGAAWLSSAIASVPAYNSSADANQWKTFDWGAPVAVTKGTSFIVSYYGLTGEGLWSVRFNDIPGPAYYIPPSHEGTAQITGAGYFTGINPGLGFTSQPATIWGVDFSTK